MASRTNKRKVDSPHRDFRALDKADPEIKRWAEKFNELKFAEEDVPKGYFSEADLANQLSMSRSGIRHYLMRLVDSGDAEYVRVRRRGGVKKRVYPQRFYKLK